MKTKLLMTLLLVSLLACAYRPPEETAPKQDPAAQNQGKDGVNKGDFFREGESTEPLPERPAPLEGMSVRFAFTENPVSLEEPVITYTVSNDSDKTVWLSGEPPMITVDQDLKQFYLDFHCVKTNTGMAFYSFSEEQVQTPVHNWTVREIKAGDDLTGAFALDLKRGGLTPGTWDVYALVSYSEEISIFSQIHRRDRVPLWITRAHTLDQSWSVTIQ